LDSLAFDARLDEPLRMQLHIALGFALVFMMGSVERIRSVLSAALEIAEHLADVDAQMRTLWTLWAMHTNIAECRAANSLAERFSHVARHSHDAADALVADRILGNTLHLHGKQREAQGYCERALELHTAPGTGQQTILFPHSQRVMAQATLARVLWLRGLVVQGASQARTCLEAARAIDDKFTACAILYYAVTPVMVFADDLAVVERAVAMSIDLATSLNAPLLQIVGSCLKAKLLIRRGDYQAGTDLLRTTLDRCEQSGWTIGYPELLGVLAEGLAGLGRFTEALATVDAALAAADRGGERWYVAELLRTKGELLPRDAGTQAISAAEACFNESLAVAQEQGALSWELRSALSLARSRVKQDRPDEARNTLAPVYQRFTEGFKTPDLRSSWALLEALATSSGRARTAKPD
jgi:hypothetical protein